MPDPSQQELATEQEAREVAEAAREEEWEYVSFARGLFEGRFELDLIHPQLKPDSEEQERAREFLGRLESFSREHIDGDAIDREGHLPREVLDGLADLGAFGIKIPREYGGLGLSQLTYGRALQIVSSYCASTGAYLSAHQSIGVPQPLMLFGTEAQKRKYLPRICDGALSAFALTEADVGSDPANMATTAEPTEDGEAWILNGEKLWTTNGPRADLMVVMARTPDREGRGRRPISAFIVESEWDGVEVAHVCDFMGLKGISNGVMRFDHVRIPKENLLWKEGKGLKLALVTLNTGRLSLPAFCSGSVKSALNMTRKWAGERVQWGQAIGKHDAIAQKLGAMAADAFAMEAVVEMTSLMADAKSFDIRLEAALAKLWHSERAWEIGNDALQIRGGRGYETADSLRARGETPMPVERMVRDLRINLIFEGSSEIMRLFIAREAVDTHLSVAGDLVDPKASFGAKLKALVKAGWHYAWWYPTRWLGWSRWPRYAGFGSLADHVRYVDRSSRRLARSVFYAMIRFGPGLEKKQAVLGRIVDIGAELLCMTAACVRARKKAGDGEEADGATELADLFCRRARRRIGARFDALFENDDDATYGVARKALEGGYDWLEEGVLTTDEFDRPMVSRMEFEPGEEREHGVADAGEGAGRAGGREPAGTGSPE